MRKLRILAAVLIVLVPVAARALWYYSGIYHREQPVEIPDYENLTIPMPTMAPISEIPVAQRQAGARIVMDVSHYNFFTLSDIELLTRDLAGLGARLELNDGSVPVSEQLKAADSYVTIAPTSPFSFEEISAITGFVERGGRLLVIADPTRNYESANYSDYYNAPATLSASDIANVLLSPFGISIQNDYVYNVLNDEGNFRNVIYTVQGEGVFTSGVETVVLYGAHSISTTQNAVIAGDDTTFSSLTDTGGGLVVAASAVDDHVLAVGDYTFLTSPYNQVNDNQQFIHNIAAFLASHDRLPTFDDFPHLFSRPVTIIQDPEEPVSPERMSLIIALQNSLQRAGVEVSFATEPIEGNDVALIGTFPLDENMKAYVEPFGLTFADEGDQEGREDTATVELTATPQITPTQATAGTEAIPAGEAVIGDYAYLDEYGETGNESVIAANIPGFGRVQADTLGFILFAPTANQNTVIFLAKSDENLASLANIIQSGSLVGCSLVGKIAVCDLGASSFGY